MLQSTDELFERTTEEILSSKAELRSVNEKLSAVNKKLAAKVKELEVQLADLKNLVGATDVASICLDLENRVRWFTPAATRTFRIKDADAGRSICDFAHDFDRGDLADVTQQVLKSLVPIEDEVSCRDGRTFLRRVFTYRSEDGHILGVIITFLDITERKKSEVACLESERRLREATKSLEEQVEHRVSALNVLHDITMAANEARSFELAIKAALERICNYNNWVLGHAWRLADDGGLTSTRVWQYAGANGCGEDFQRIRDAREQTLLPADDGFIGAVVRSGQPQWQSNVQELAAPGEGFGSAFGLRSAVAFPVLSQGAVVAVLEFFANREMQPDERFLEIMPQVGIQLGHVYERKRLERDVAIVADSEQLRMGQEMHDGLSQQITGIAMLCGTLADSLKAEDSPLADKAARVLRAVEEAKLQARAISKGLMPIEIDRNGFKVALEELAERTEKTYGIQCKFETHDLAVQTDSFTATHLYRIAREAVHNSLRHGKAKRIWIEVADADGITLIVRDDGVGIDLAYPVEGVGLRIMRHRAGLINANLSIRRMDEGGTMVVCKVGG